MNTFVIFVQFNPCLKDQKNKICELFEITILIIQTIIKTFKS